jgi:hypothetical protein
MLPGVKATMNATQLDPGDVLLFRKPELKFSWDYRVKEGTTGSTTWDQMRIELYFHDLIAELDCCDFTHAAMVLDPRDGGTWIGNSDQDGLQIIELDAIRWEYGKYPFRVLRLKSGAPIKDIVDAATTIATAPTGQSIKYPDFDMLPAAHLLALRNRPVQLPLLDHHQNLVVNTAIRVASDRWSLANHQRWLKQMQGITRWQPLLGASKPVKTSSLYGWMCAAYVAFACAAASHPLYPVIRPNTYAPRAPGARYEFAPVEIATECFDGLTYAFANPIFKRGPSYEPVIAAELRAAIARNHGFVEQAWLAYGSKPSGAPRTAKAIVSKYSAVAAVPIVAPFATAYDLEHNRDQFDVVGECAW